MTGVLNPPHSKAEVSRWQEYLWYFWQSGSFYLYSGCDNRASEKSNGQWNTWNVKACVIIQLQDGTFCNHQPTSQNTVITNKAECFLCTYMRKWHGWTMKREHVARDCNVCWFTGTWKWLGAAGEGKAHQLSGIWLRIVPSGWINVAKFIEKLCSSSIFWWLPLYAHSWFSGRWKWWTVERRTKPSNCLEYHYNSLHKQPEHATWPHECQWMSLWDMLVKLVLTSASKWWAGPPVVWDPSQTCTRIYSSTADSSDETLIEKQLHI